MHNNKHKFSQNRSKIHNREVILTTSCDVAIFKFSFILHSITSSENTETIKQSIIELTLILV